MRYTTSMLRHARDHWIRRHRPENEKRVGGLTLLLAALFVLAGPDAFAVKANLASNGTFEADPCTHYFTSPGDCAAGMFSWASDYSHSAGKSLKIVSQQPASALARWLSKNDTIAVKPGHVYQVSLWLKTENARQHAELAANFWGPGSGTFISANGRSSQIITGTSGWARVAVEVTAPEKAGYMRVEARLYGSGTMWADDLEIYDLSANLAPNAGFEVDSLTDYLRLATDFTHNIFSQTSDTYHSGAKALMIESRQPYGEFASWLSNNDAIEITSGKTYEVSVWLKTKDVAGRAELAANFWGPGAGDRILVNGTVSTSVSGTQDWQKVSIRVTAPAPARYLKVEMRIFGSGTIWADDISVRDVAFLSSAPDEIKTAPQSAAPAVLTTGRGVTITRWLTHGSSGSDVLNMQEYLKNRGYFPKDVVANGYFGPTTRASLERFQCVTLQVCSGTPETTGYGATGPRTRKALGQIP